MAYSATAFLFTRKFLWISYVIKNSLRSNDAQLAEKKLAALQHRSHANNVQSTLFFIMRQMAWIEEKIIIDE